jgi:hypothetical protein
VLNWVMVEGVVAAERISQFLSEGSAVDYIQVGQPFRTAEIDPSLLIIVG